MNYDPRLAAVCGACSGTWIAHGNGDCDRDFVDAADRCPAPAHPGSLRAGAADAMANG